MVLVIITQVIVLLNSPRVQRSLWITFVEPQLETLQLHSDFQGFNYTFPNSIELRPLSLFTTTDTLLKSEKILFNELSFSKGWTLSSLEAFGLEIDLTAMETINSKLRDTASSQGFNITVSEMSLPNVKLVGDSLSTVIDLSGAGLRYHRELNIESLAVNGHWDTIPILFQGHTIVYEDSNISGGVKMAVSNMGRLEGKVAGTLNEVNFTGLLGLNPASTMLPVEFERYHLPQSYEIQLSFHDLDSMQSAITFKNSAFVGEMQLSGAITTQIEAALTFDVMDDSSVHYPSNIPRDIIPNKFQLNGVFSEGITKDIRVQAESNSAIYTLNINDINRPAYINASINKTGLQNLESLTFKSAIKPNITSLFTQEWNATGVFPRLDFVTHTSKGLSFDLHHHGVNDSVWLTCLDTLLDVEGYVLHKGDHYCLDFEAHAIGLDLFDPLDTGQVVSGQFNGNYHTATTGNISVSKLLLQRPKGDILLESLKAQHTFEKGIRSFTIQSDVANGSLVGDWEFQTLPQIIDFLVTSAYDGGTKKVWPKASFNGYLKVGEVNWLADLLHLPLEIESGSTSKWDYNQSDKNWSIQSSINSGVYGGYALSELDLDLHQQGDSFAAAVAVDKIEYDQGLLRALKGESYGSGLERNVRFSGTFEDSIPSVLAGAFTYQPGRAALQHMNFNIGLDTFALSGIQAIEWDSKSIKSDHLAFSGSAGSLIAKGMYSLWNSQLHRGVIHVKMNARPLNYMIRTPEAILGGMYAFDMEFKDDAPVNWLTTASITGLTLNDVPYGSFKGQLVYEPFKSDVFIQGQLLADTQQATILRGHYNTAVDDLDVNLSVNKLNVTALNPFFHEAIAGVSGHLEGGIQLYGPLKDWKTRGELYWNRGEMEIPLLGTQFTVGEQSLISLSDEGFELDSIVLYSKTDQTKALAWGTIRQHQLKDFALDLRLSTDSLLAMRKARNVEDMFYGDAVVAGNMHLEGPVEQLQLTVEATTKEGTALKIPLDNPTAVELPGFIRFIDTELPEIKVQSINDMHDYFGADLGIEVTPEAKIELVLDEVLGDIIRAQGSGSMRLKILEDESVELFGVYTVQEGDYLFTLQNVINKQFQLVPGGTIAWSGDVYEAALDLKAIYRVQTDLTGLVTSANYNNEKVPVDLIISLTGPLLSPEIDFEIALPASPASYQQELNRHFLNEEALHYQAFSLLMLGDFFQQNLAIQERINFESSLGNTTSELLVSEFGSWLAAGIGDYVNVDFDYTTGAQPLANMGNQVDNLNLGVSKNFFDGKLRLASTFDVPVGQEQTSTLLLGDTEVSLDISKQGTLLLKAFNRSNRNDPLLQNTGPYVQGVGIQFKKDFDRVIVPSKTDVQ